MKVRRQHNAGRFKANTSTAHATPKIGGCETWLGQCLNTHLMY